MGACRPNAEKRYLAAAILQVPGAGSRQSDWDCERRECSVFDRARFCILNNESTGYARVQIGIFGDFELLQRWPEDETLSARNRNCLLEDFDATPMPINGG